MWLLVATMLIIGVGTVANSADAATVLMVLAGIVLIVAMIEPSVGALSTLTERSVVRVASAGLIVQTLTIPTRAPLGHPAYSAALMGLAAIGLYSIFAQSRARWVGIAVVAAGYLAVMSWMIASLPRPDIDVYVFQQEGARAFLAGENPFAMRFDIVAYPGHPYYSPDVIEGGRLDFGFIYPPLSLLLALPGVLLAGDYRFGAVAALSVGFVVLASMHHSPRATAAGLLLLFAPMTQQVLYYGWTDPFVILLLAVSAVALGKRSRLSPIALGLVVAVKQYMAVVLVLAPVLLLALRRRVGTRAMVLIPAVVAVLTTAPFVLWDADSLLHSAVVVHLLQPFRADSLSVPAMLVRSGFPEPPTIIGFAFGATALAVTSLRAARTATGFFVGTAFVLMLFFLFSKQAFLHYYFLVAGLIACGVAAADLCTSPDDAPPCGSPIA